MDARQLERIETMCREGRGAGNDVVIAPDWLEDLVAELKTARGKADELLVSLNDARTEISRLRVEAAAALDKERAEVERLQAELKTARRDTYEVVRQWCADEAQDALQRCASDDERKAYERCADVVHEWKCEASDDT